MPTQIVVFGVAVAAIAGAGMYMTQTRMEICHQTGSEEHPWEIIKVSERSWPAHEAHGDKYPVPEAGCDALEDPGTPGTPGTPGGSS
ncbi:MAG: hypothetical protein OQJ98_00765 [Candidatus Pacebacteria bacterium]|nr:hypothetical protein [Candidatus Paceibacterota bacterium]